MCLYPWNEGFLEWLIIAQLVKIFHAFYGIRRFLIMYTRVNNGTIACAICIQLTLSRHKFKFHYNINLTSTPISRKLSLLFRVSHQNFVCISVKRPTHPILDSYHKSAFTEEFKMLGFQETISLRNKVVLVSKKTERVRTIEYLLQNVSIKASSFYNK
jgi:hypothetical protein